MTIAERTRFIGVPIETRPLETGNFGPVRVKDHYGEMSAGRPVVGNLHVGSENEVTIFGISECINSVTYKNSEINNLKIRTDIKKWRNPLISKTVIWQKD